MKHHVEMLAGDGTVLKPDPYAPSRQNRVDDLIPRARSRVCCHGRNLPSRTECLIRVLIRPAANTTMRPLLPTSREERLVH